MRGTDTINIGDGYYVYLNWEFECHLVEEKIGLRTWDVYHTVWAGEHVDCPLTIDGRKFIASNNCIITTPDDAPKLNAEVMEEVKSEVKRLIFIYRKEIMKIIKNDRN